MKTQKIFLLFVVAGFLLAFFSCKKDPVNLIEGTWKFDGILVDLYTDHPDPDMNLFLKKEIGKNLDMGNTTIVFNEDGTYTMLFVEDGETYTTEGRYSLEGNKFIWDDKSYSYSIDKKRFLITDYIGTTNMEEIPDVTIYNLTVTMVFIK